MGSTTSPGGGEGTPELSGASEGDSASLVGDPYDEDGPPMEWQEVHATGDEVDLGEGEDLEEDTQTSVPGGWEPCVEWEMGGCRIRMHTSRSQ